LISSNASVADLSGLESLTAVGGELMITYQTAFTDLDEPVDQYGSVRGGDKPDEPPIAGIIHSSD
jgi:hypothetical protein